MALIKVGILGLSQRIGRFNELGLRSWEEAGCAEVERRLQENGGEEVFYIHRPLVIRGGQANLQRLLREWCDAPDAASRCDLILTVAGTGPSHDDVMPEATQAVIKQALPGVAGFVRYAGYLSEQPDAVLSRGVAGIRNGTLIVNLPGPANEIISPVMEKLTPMLPRFVQAVQSGRSR